MKQKQLDIDKINLDASRAINLLKELTDKIAMDRAGELSQEDIKTAILMSTVALMSLHVMVNRDLQIRGN